MLTRRLGLILLLIGTALLSSAVRRTFFAGPEDGFALLGYPEISGGETLRLDSAAAVSLGGCDGDFSFTVRLRADPQGYAIALTTAAADTLLLDVASTGGYDPLRDEEGTRLWLSRTGEKMSEIVFPRKKFSLSANGYCALQFARRGYDLVISAGHGTPGNEAAAVSGFADAVREILILPRKGKSVEIERAQLSLFSSAEQMLSTGLTAESVAALAAESSDAVCGIWSLLDFDLDDSYMRIGGDYTIAVVPLRTLADEERMPDICRDMPDDALAIVYLSGASADAWRWTPGMIKGFLFPSQIGGAWRVRWHDSEGLPLDEPETVSMATATLEDGATILRLSFPERYSTVRFLRKQ